MIQIFLIISLLFTNIALAKDKIVAITQIVEHPSLNQVKDEVINQLKLAGYEEGKNLKIIYESAQGNIAMASQIAKEFISINPDVLVAISTPSAQTIVNANRKTNYPIVFAAVSDPLYAKLVNDIDNVKSNITGATDEQPTDQQLKLIKNIIPNIKTLGVIFNSGEVNSVKIVSDLEKNNEAIKIAKSVVLKSSDIDLSAKRLIGKVDAIFIPLDNTVVSGLSNVLKVAFENNIPVFSSDPDLVNKGILASIGNGYNKIGSLAGEMVVDILNGKEASSIKISAPKNPEIYVNLNSSKKLNITIPQEILEQAKHIVD